MVVCICKGVSERALAAAVERGANHLEAVAACTGLGTQCGKCREMARRLIEAIGLPCRADCRPEPTSR